MWSLGGSFENNPRAGVLLVMHSFYGLSWCFKDLNFPDEVWKRPATWVSCVSFYAFSLILCTPILCQVAPEKCFGPAPFTHYSWTFIGLASFITGIFYHYGSDAQKYFQIRAQPGKLITEGFWRYTRNPNYLGEFLIYTGYITVSGHSMPAILVVTSWVTLMFPSILKKECRLERYSEWSEYKKKTPMILPSVSMVLSDLKYLFRPLPEERNQKW